jgi:hypothetical protein
MSVPRAGRPEASAEIWCWRRGKQEGADRAPPAHARPRLRGTIQGLVACAIGGLLVTRGRSVPGTAALVIGGVVLFSALISPVGLYAGIERAFAAVGRSVGRVLSWVLMPAAFYGFFLPFHVLFRRGRRDSMRRFFEPEAPSYWKVRPQSANGGSRQRQY